LEILLSLFALVLLLGGIVLVIWGIIAALDEHTPGSPITILVGAILFLVGIGLSGIRIIPSGNVPVSTGSPRSSMTSVTSLPVSRPTNSPT
jgi:hypothetical protein